MRLANFPLLCLFISPWHKQPSPAGKMGRIEQPGVGFLPNKYAVFVPVCSGSEGGVDGTKIQSHVRGHRSLGGIGRSCRLRMRNI